MSSGNKSSVSSGGRGTSKNKTSQHGKSDHQFKSSDLTKQDKIQQKSDQTRHSQIIDTRMGCGEDPTFKERVKQVMEVTRRTEDEVIMALHDSDGDFNRAVNDLLEGVSPEWEVKKKKARQPSSSKQNTEQLGVQDEGGEWDSDRRIQRGGGPPRMRGRVIHDNRGWRGRENKENERNMEESGRDSGFQGGNRRGRGGLGRSGRGGRGGGRGLGPRTFANRGDQSSSSHSFNRPIETWTGSEEQSIQEPKMDAWNNLEPSEDWDNEEYQGSLADTKVFTPSTSLTDEQKLQDLQSQAIQTVTLTPLQQEDLPKLSEMPVIQQSLGPQQSQASQHPVLSLSGIQLNQQSNTISSGSLTAAQSQYFTQLSQQSGEALKTAGQPSYSSTISSQPQRQTKQRPRIPPPSKIPSSAVEMPGDAVNSTMGILDVQFGAMDFGADTSSLDGSLSDKYTASTTISIDMNSNSNTSNTTSSTTNSLDMESVQSSNQYNTSGQMLANDSLSSSDHSLNSQSFTNRGCPTTQSLDISKQDFTSQVSPSATNYGSTVTYSSQKASFQAQTATPNSYSAYSSVTPAAQSFPSVTVGNSNSYSATVSVSQASYNTSAAYPQSSSASFSQVSPSTSVSATGVFNQTATSNQTYQSTNAYTPTTSSQYQGQSIATNTANSNSSSNNNTAYQATGYQGSSSFPSAPQSYQPSSGSFSSPITQGSGVYQNASAYAYSTYGSPSQSSSHNHKLNSTGNKDSQYETSTTTSNNSLATTTTPNLGLSSSSVNSSQTKVTNSNSVPKSTSSGIVTGTGNTGNMTVANATNNMTPAILGHQYIMGQSVPGVFPTYQQMYSYEELQMMRSMQPHMPTTGYYDAALGYQTTGPATSLGANRGDALSGIQGVQGVQGAYTSISDARFARNDSNASPVPSTMSQQTATQHQQPMMNAIPPPGYYFTYGMPGGFQYGAPLYPQIATAGNAGTSSGAYSAKPGSYGSSYGGGTSYDSLASTGQAAEYKGAGSGYTSSQTGKSGTSTGNANSSGSTAADISAGMYAAKSHVALSKVNSYDKQTFHSATPPPFGLTGSQNAGLPGSYGTPHLFIPAMHQPHQLHQPLHQDGSNSTGQRTNPSSQNKAQTKPGYSPSYWTGGN